MRCRGRVAVARAELLVVRHEVAEGAEHRFVDAHREGEESSATLGLYTQTLTVRDNMTLYAEEGFDVVLMEAEEKSVYTEVHIADELNFRVRSEWK